MRYVGTVPSDGSLDKVTCLLICDFFLFDTVHCARFDFLPTLIPDVHHPTIHTHTHRLVMARFSTLGNIPVWNGIGLRTCSLFVFQQPVSPLLHLPPDAAR
jgi:hypothetical protein